MSKEGPGAKERPRACCFLPGAVIVPKSSQIAIYKTATSTFWLGLLSVWVLFWLIYLKPYRFKFVFYWGSTWPEIYLISISTFRYYSYRPLVVSLSRLSPLQPRDEFRLYEIPKLRAGRPSRSPTLLQHKTEARKTLTQAPLPGASTKWIIPHQEEGGNFFRSISVV